MEYLGFLQALCFKKAHGWKFLILTSILKVFRYLKYPKPQKNCRCVGALKAIFGGIETLQALYIKTEKPSELFLLHL